MSKYSVSLFFNNQFVRCLFGEADLFFCASGDLASQRALADDRELPRVQELPQGQLGSSNQYYGWHIATLIIQKVN